MGSKFLLGAYIDEVVAATSEVIDRVASRLPPDFPGRLLDFVTKGLRKAARQLEGER